LGEIGQKHPIDANTLSSAETSNRDSALVEARRQEKEQRTLQLG
jgi:hypothetical protein